VNSAAVLELLRREAASGRASRRIWYLYVLEEWLRAERGEIDAMTPLAA
jgi:hypothetical protein